MGAPMRYRFRGGAVQRFLSFYIYILNLTMLNDRSFTNFILNGGVCVRPQPWNRVRNMSHYFDAFFWDLTPYPQILVRCGHRSVWCSNDALVVSMMIHRSQRLEPGTEAAGTGRCLPAGPKQGLQPNDHVWGTKCCSIPQGFGDLPAMNGFRWSSWGVSDWWFRVWKWGYCNTRNLWSEICRDSPVDFGIHPILGNFRKSLDQLLGCQGHLRSDVFKVFGKYSLAGSLAGGGADGHIWKQKASIPMGQRVQNSWPKLEWTEIRKVINSVAPW